MVELRRAQLSDYDVLMERVVASFREGNPSHGRFEDLYPDSICRSRECMAQWLLVLEDGELAAGLQVVPRAMVAAGYGVPVVGIGNVFCYPPHRRHGFMSQLLRAAIVAMEEDGFAVAMLGGDRTRYGHFGWEHAGSSRRLSLSGHVKRHCRFVSGDGLGLREWRQDVSDTRRMFEAYCSHPYRLNTDLETFALALSRPGQVVWLSDSDTEGFAYASVRGRTILEYAGSRTALERILAFLLSCGEYSVVVPPGTAETELEHLFLDSAASYTVVPTGMINVLSIHRVLQAYRGLLEERLGDWEGTLAIVDAEKGEGVTVERGKSGLLFSRTTEPGRGDEKTLALPTRQLATLCFGPFQMGPGKWAEHPVVRRMFPLPIHWHALAHV